MKPGFVIRTKTVQRSLGRSPGHAPPPPGPVKNRLTLYSSTPCRLVEGDKTLIEP